mmetsp:Transcript_16911/g.39374  ORF Transcript_16911/g.39374 Transcript_16911/m.39374 type:complete len:122 (-) Transcript_16911:150-515(-)
MGRQLPRRRPGSVQSLAAGKAADDSGGGGHERLACVAVAAAAAGVVTHQKVTWRVSQRFGALLIWQHSALIARRVRLSCQFLFLSAASHYCGCSCVGENTPTLHDMFLHSSPRQMGMRCAP